MAVFSATIRAYFDLTALGGDFFTLDDPVKGVLDGPYVLAGPIGTDLSEYAETVTIHRGRHNALDEIETGVATITLDNTERTFDPLHGGSPFAGSILPGKRMAVEVDGITIFDGNIDDWDLEYRAGSTPTATAIVFDALGTLAAKEFDEWTTTAEQTAGPRLVDILNRSEVAFPGGARDIDTGISTLQSDLVTWGSNVLNYAQLVAKSDLGRLFASRTGVLTFRDRHATIDARAGVVLSDGTFDTLNLVTDEAGAIVTDEAGNRITPYSSVVVVGAEFDAVDLQYGGEQLYNRVGVDRTGGVKQTVTDTVSAAAYGTRSLSLSELLLDSDSQSADMAHFLLSLYAAPEVRVSSVTVNLIPLSGVARAGLLGLELGDLVRFVFTPNQVGAPIDAYHVVEGIEHQISKWAHMTTFRLSEATQRSVFILDDPIFGVLDGVGVLAF